MKLIIGDLIVPQQPSKEISGLTQEMIDKSIAQLSGMSRDQEEVMNDDIVLKSKQNLWWWAYI